jgi:hypothetical protein|tara:strand:+ start:810 stop:2246 length:1437 start_codon:yes stop_codon:yes gene_type:complete
MAITIKLEPQTFQSVYNEVIVVLDSDNRNEDKFQYVAEISIDGVLSSSLEVQSNPQGWGVINLSKHLEGAISSKMPSLTDGSTFGGIPESYAEYTIALYESFLVTSSYNAVTDSGGNAQFALTATHPYNVGDNVNISNITGINYGGFQTVIAVPTSTSIVTSRTFAGTGVGTLKASSNTATKTLDAAAVFTETKYITNNVLDFLDVPNWDYQEYLLSASRSNKFLTNLPITYYSRFDDSITLNFKPEISSITDYLRVTTNKGSFYIANPNTVMGSDTRFQSVKVGIKDLEAATLVGITPAGQLPMFDDNTISYTVDIVTTAFVIASETRTFIVDRTCTGHEPVKLMYLNRGGSYSPYNFAGATSRSTKVKKTNYQKSYGSYNDITTSYAYDSLDVGTKRLSTSVREKFKINTDYIPDVIGDLIEDLIISPQVYKVEANGDLRAIEITTSSVKIKRKLTDKLISYSLDYEYSTNNSNQK